MTHWYGVIKGERRGPLTWEELQACVTRGELQPDDYVWTAAFGDTWRRAREVPELLPPPPPPAAASLTATPPTPQIVTLAPLSDDDHAPSCLVALQEAWTRMTTVLFNPFDIALWLGIGLCAWFASVGRFDWTGLLDAKEAASNFHSGMASGNWHEAIAAFSDMLKERFNAVVTFSAVAVTVLFALVMMWVRARGALLFVDRWHRPHAPLAETWRLLRQLGNSLFMMRLMLTFGFLSTLVLGGVAGVTLRVADLVAWSPELATPRVLWAGGMLLTVTAWWVVGELDNQFVVPVMYWRRINAVAAWRVVFGFCNRRPFAIIRFLAFRVLFEAVVAVGVTLVTLLTCCLFWVVRAIPYFGSVVYLPVTFFRRGLGLSYLQQWKPDLPGRAAGET